MMATKKAPITETQKTAAEEQIRALRKEIDYNTRDYSIAVSYTHLTLPTIRLV